MHTNLIVIENFEQLLLSKWATFLDRSLLIRSVLEDVRDSELRIVTNEKLPPAQIKITITKFKVVSNSNFEIWVEFNVPKTGSGVVVGTHVYTLGLNGDLTLQETYGVLFCPK